MMYIKTYKKTITLTLFLLLVSLVKLPSMDDLLNLIWVDVIPIHPTIENSIVNIGKTPHVDKYEHCFLYALLAFIMWLEVPKKNKFKAYYTIFIYAISLGIIIEFLQELTPHRTANFMDAIANTIGISFTLILIFLISYIYERKRKNLPDCTNPPKRCWGFQCQTFSKLFR